jgi:hypothetical protein
MPAGDRELRDALRGWVDCDVAQWALAKAAGLMPDVPWNPGDETMPGYGMRSALQSQNLLSGSLDRILDELAVLGAIERGEDGRCRWRKDFDWQAASDLEDQEERYRRPADPAITGMQLPP